MRKLCEEFKYFKGQPIEIITDGMRFCGIDIEAGDDAVLLIDDCGRLVRVEYKHIDAVIEPQMKLNRLCSRHDCDCDCNNDCDCDCNNSRDYDCERA